MERFWSDFGGPGGPNSGERRNARALAGLFEFEEFEDYFENESRHAPTLRVAADDGKRLGAERKAAESCASLTPVALRGECGGGVP